MDKKYILVCEKRWRKIRELSLDLAEKGISSTVLIRGLVRPDVERMITAHKEISNVFVPEKLFTLILFMRMATSLILCPRRRLLIALSKEKTYKRLEILKKIFRRIELAKVFD